MELRHYWTLNKTSGFKLNQDKARINLQPQPTYKLENRFDALTIEDPVAELERDSLAGCPDKANNNNNKPKRNYFKSSKTQGYQSKPQHPNQTRKTEKKTLDIGDSMVKNIDEKKIEKAARGKTVCHSYSGATLSQ